MLLDFPGAWVLYFCGGGFMFLLLLLLILKQYDAITFCCIFINIKGEMFVCLSSCSSSPRYTCFTYTKIIKQNADCFWGNIPFCFCKLEVGKS